MLSQHQNSCPLGTHSILFYLVAYLLLIESDNVIQPIDCIVLDISGSSCHSKSLLVQANASIFLKKDYCPGFMHIISEHKTLRGFRCFIYRAGTGKHFCSKTDKWNVLFLRLQPTDKGKRLKIKNWQVASVFYALSCAVVLRNWILLLAAISLWCDTVTVRASHQVWEWTEAVRCCKS